MRYACRRNYLLEKILTPKSLAEKNTLFETVIYLCKLYFSEVNFTQARLPDWLEVHTRQSEIAIVVEE